MTEQLRYRFSEYAKHNGHELMTCIWYSSTTKKWSQRKMLTQLIQDYKPEFIFLTLGANELSLPAIKSHLPYIKGLIAEAKQSGIPFIWIGPPNWIDDTGLNKLLAENLKKGQFFYSGHLKEALADKRQKDGAHPNRVGANLWTDEIMKWCRAKSIFKDRLLLDSPQDSSRRALSSKVKAVPCRVPSTKYNTRIIKTTDRPYNCPQKSKLPKKDTISTLSTDSNSHHRQDSLVE